MRKDRGWMDWGECGSGGSERLIYPLKTSYWCLFTTCKIVTKFHIKG